MSKSSDVREKSRPLLVQGAQMASIGPEAMTDNDSMALERAVTDDCTDLEKRDVRALTEYMTVLPLGGEMYSVTTESGSEYRVDACEGRCTCPDKQYNLPTDEGRESCKHLSRIAFATGKRSIPQWTDADAIDPHIGEHTDDTVCQNSPAGFSVSATDGVETAADKLETDGGTVGVTDDSDACPNGDDRCDGPNGDGLPCFDCFELSEGQ